MKYSHISYAESAISGIGKIEYRTSLPAMPKAGKPAGGFRSFFGGATAKHITNS